MSVAIDGWIQCAHRNFQDIGEVQKVGVRDLVYLAFNFGETFPANAPPFELDFDHELRLRASLLVT